MKKPEPTLRPVLVLDDPFSALDRGTEDAAFTSLKTTRGIRSSS